jgi:hypothetical protein
MLFNAMNVLPCPAKVVQVIGQFPPNSRQIALGESVVLTHLDGAVRTIQVEYRFTSSAKYVHVRGTMIVRINHNPQSAEPKDRRHGFIVAYILSD